MKPRYPPDWHNKFLVQLGTLILGAALSACAPNRPVTATPAAQEMRTSTATANEVAPTASTTPVTSADMPAPRSREDYLRSRPQLTFFKLLMRPLAAEAERRRSERASKDAGWAKRIDNDLNRGRVNILLFGYGYPEDYRPEMDKPNYEGSPSILSFDLINGQVDVVSLTHDIRAPEIEQASYKPGEKRRAIKIDQAYWIGNFDLMRKTIEDATGLAVDFQVAFDETIIRDLVDQVFGGVVIDVPRSFDGIPVYVDGTLYTARFEKGSRRFSGTDVIVFIKTAPLAPKGKYYGKDLEHNVRKALVFEALLKSFKASGTDAKLWGKLAWFITEEQARFWARRIDYDFDPIALTVANIRDLLPDWREATQARQIGFPQIRKTLYVQDAANGDGGVGWVIWQAGKYPVVRKDVEEGIYPPEGDGFAAPLDGDPHAADLVTGYWGSCRKLIKDSLPTAP